jgi:hypothetical protein
VGWQHDINIDKNSRKVQYKYCHKIFSGDIYHFKHHLTCTRKDVEPCQQVLKDDFKCFGEKSRIKKKRKAFQYIRRDKDKNKRNEIKLVDKGKRETSESGSMQNYH